MMTATIRLKSKHARVIHSCTLIMRVVASHDFYRIAISDTDVDVFLFFCNTVWLFWTPKTTCLHKCC